MNIYAVISEFNPFHNGHEYLVRSVKERDGDAAIVAVMSGSFVQRGDVAIIDKYTRAEAAVRCGVDLVLELPAPWCFSGAEFFALGGVGVANGIGITDKLVFGSESGDADELSRVADGLMSDEFAAECAALRYKLPNLNAATLRERAYSDLFGESVVFSGSNNLLALEYIKALKKLDSKITVGTVKRIGEAFNSENLGQFCSATAIREALSANAPDYSTFMPEVSAKVLRRELDAGRRYSFSCLDTAIIARLRTCDPSEIADIMEIDGGFENRLTAIAQKVRTPRELVEALCDKRHSASRVRRSLIALMLGVRMSDVEKPPLFTSVLAANGRGREVLSAARKRASIDVLSKMSDAKRLTGDAARQYELHLRAERLAELCCVGEPEKRGAVMI